MSSFIHSKNFRARLIGGVFLALVTIPSYFLLEGLPYRIVMTIGFVLGLIELFSIASESYFFPALKDLFVIAGIFLSLSLSIIAMWNYSILVTGGVVVVVGATDVFAYFGGNLLGGKIFRDGRPFPTISPKKTWEGCAIGLIFGLVASMLWTELVLKDASMQTRMLFGWMPIFAIAGDVLESYLKRRAGVKDSNEFLAEVPILKQIEGLLGGKGGHGGYLDRLDAVSFVMAVYFIIDMVILNGLVH